MMWSVVHAEPTPRARSASMKDQTAGRIEPYTDACASVPRILHASLDARDDVHRNLVEVLCQIARRIDDARELARARIVGGSSGRIVPAVRSRSLEGAAVEPGERGALLGVGHYQEVPAWSFEPVRCLEGDLDRALEDGWLHGAGEVETLPDWSEWW